MSSPEPSHLASSPEALSPPETRLMKRAVLLLALVSLVLLGLTPPSAPFFARTLSGVLAACVLALSAARARSLLNIASLVLGITVLMAWGVLWQVSLGLSLALTVLVQRYIPQSSAPPIKRGRIPLGLTVFAGVVTPGALIGWVYFLEPDISDLTRMIPEAHIGLLIFGGVLFALVNAAFEEFVWRGILQPALQVEFGLAWAIILQALSFGLAHAYGFPRGPVGVALAGTWAVILGVLRHRANGVLAPFLAHVVADATIAAIMIWLALSA